ncbi:MAG TPA: hypothetical protein VF267_04750 [Gammaproteobacteria bacterium]
MMRSTPERLSFSDRLLLAFALPLIIRVLVSLATVIALQDSLCNRTAVVDTQQVIALAAEYFNSDRVASCSAPTNCMRSSPHRAGTIRRRRNAGTRR